MPWPYLKRSSSSTTLLSSAQSGVKPLPRQLLILPQLAASLHHETCCKASRHRVSPTCTSRRVTSFRSSAPNSTKLSKDTAKSQCNIWAQGLIMTTASASSCDVKLLASCKKKEPKAFSTGCCVPSHSIQSHCATPRPEMPTISYLPMIVGGEESRSLSPGSRWPICLFDREAGKSEILRMVSHQEPFALRTTACGSSPARLGGESRLPARRGRSAIGAKDPTLPERFRVRRFRSRASSIFSFRKERRACARLARLAPSAMTRSWRAASARSSGSGPKASDAGAAVVGASAPGPETRLGTGATALGTGATALGLGRRGICCRNTAPTPST
mmetsp:Transcript_51694/g.143139  ORF Transcript_51694/g.143139 Transcript_51694/m.143139 type:complete len:330 (+) Transcript_51694:314-1303(+)